MRLQEIIKHGIFYHCDDFAKFQASSAHNKKAIVDRTRVNLLNCLFNCVPKTEVELYNIAGVTRC